MALFGGELTPGEVSEHYQAWLDGRPESLMNDEPAGLYVFRERPGNIVHNQITSGSDLVIPESFRIPFKPFLKAPWTEFSFSRPYLRDVFINVSGFVPFGFFFCMYFSWGRASRRTVLATIVLGAVFSLTIEVLQWYIPMRDSRSEEHTSELQSLTNLVCRLLLEKKKKNTMIINESTEMIEKIN